MKLFKKGDKIRFEGPGWYEYDDRDGIFKKVPEDKVEQAESNAMSIAALWIHMNWDYITYEQVSKI